VTHFIFLYFLASTARLFKEYKNKLAAAQPKGWLHRLCLVEASI